MSSGALGNFSHAPSSPAFKGSRNGKSIRVLQITSSRQSLSKSTQTAIISRKNIRQVISGGIPFHIRTQRQNNLYLRQLLQSLEQRGDPKIIRANIIKG